MNFRQELKVIKLFGVINGTGAETGTVRKGLESDEKRRKVRDI